MAHEPLSEAEFNRRLRAGLIVLQSVARRMARRLSGHVAFDDLVALGKPALLDAARSFDAMRAEFEPYAAMKMKWAILDGIRRETHARSVVTRARALAASEQLAQDQAQAFAESPHDDSVESSKQVFAGMLGGHAAALALGLTSSLRNTASQGERAAPESKSEASPEDLFERAEFLNLLRRALDQLPERERALIERHYYGGEQFDAIARDLGISKSWASRLHVQAIQALARVLSLPELE